MTEQLKKEIVTAAQKIIFANEGNYGSVNADDNGAVSVGKVQWHGTRALYLLKTICKAENRAATILGAALYREITTVSDWGTRTVTAAEKTVISTILTTASGKAAQDELAEADVTAYVDHGIKLGIEDPKALVYFADLENQGGAGASKRVAAAGTVTLSSIHAAALADSVMGRYSSRRNRVYNKANALNFTAGNGGNKMGVIDTAVQWMVGIANDNSHGYDQANRWGPNYDCSSLVITAYERAGVPVKSKGGATYTGNMKRAFLNNGFKNVTSSVNLSTGAGLKKGDVLLNETHHTALVVTDGAGTIVHASINEKGTAVGGASGDQTGKEICTRSYYNYPWGCVLRYGQGGSTSGGQTYTVRSGDTLSSIAEKYGTTYQVLASYNGIADPNRIIVGQVIRIPGSASGSSNVSGNRTYTVRQGDSLWAIAASQLGNGSRHKEIKTLNGLASDTIYAGQTLKLPN